MMSQEPQVAVVDFHHARGPEIEFWVMPEGDALYNHNDWSLLPFMALSDGAHTSTEDFSYFTLLRKGSGSTPSTSLFGISCTRQISASRLKNKSPEVTRSTVQKALVVLTEEPQTFGQLKETLSAVTNAWFAQEDFSDIDILKEFQASLAKTLPGNDEETDYNLGLSLRELIHEFRHQTLVLFKCLLLQRKMLFFGSRCERICMMQLSLISLIPGLVRNLQDCADPALDGHARLIKKPTSLRTSDRNSLHAYMGIPLQIFGKGSFFGPYTPLQQLDILADYDTKAYLVGSTNSLLLQQKDRYSDILVNLDESNSVTITSPSLRTALALSAADRRWIDFLTQTVNDTWDPENPSRPRNMGYLGSEEFIRLQFEEYLLALLSSASYTFHHPISYTTQQTESTHLPPTDPTIDFNPDFLSAWHLTNNFTIFTALTTGAHIFDIVEPRHPTAGGLSVEDIQRRLARQVADLHLDDRMREGRDLVNRGLASGRERVSRLWGEIEARRERSSTGGRAGVWGYSVGRVSSDDNNRKENVSLNNLTAQPDHNTRSTNTADVTNEDLTLRNPSNTPSNTSSINSTTTTINNTWSTLRERAVKATSSLQRPDTSQVQVAARENAAKAGAYLNSWGTWAKERGKEWSNSTAGGGGGNNNSGGSGEVRGGGAGGGTK